MESTRLPRFRRVPGSIRVMELTQRDAEILRLVAEHRFLRSNQIMLLTDGSAQHLLRRLQLLFHHGYLDRPRSQLTYFNQGGSKSIVYGLGNKGATFLAESGNVGQRVNWSERQVVKQLQLQHTLLVSDIMVALEEACARSGQTRLVREVELAARSKVRDPFRWEVNVGSRRIGLRPDKVFGLENTATGDKAYYFLEADRGTMPVTRRGLDHSSIHRKLLAYEATWKQNLHRTRFGFHRFRVITVTTSRKRLTNLIEVCRNRHHTHGLFLFGDTVSLHKTDDLLAIKWQTANGGASALLD